MMGGIGLGMAMAMRDEGRDARETRCGNAREIKRAWAVLQSASSQRPGGMLCGKFKFARQGEGKQREGYVSDMGRTRMDWMETRRGTGNGPRATGNGGRVTERGRNAKPMEMENGKWKMEVDMEIEMGQA
jgi:hypothetical protein